jgi:hypothetical protein
MADKRNTPNSEGNSPKSNGGAESDDFHLSLSDGIEIEAAAWSSNNSTGSSTQRRKLSSPAAGGPRARRWAGFLAARPLFLTGYPLVDAVFGATVDPDQRRRNRRKLYRLIAKEGLPAFLLAGQWTARPETLERWIRGREQANTQGEVAE